MWRSNQRSPAGVKCTFKRWPMVAAAGVCRWTVAASLPGVVKSGLTFGTPHTLFERPVVAWLRNSMAVSPDGQRFLISIEVPEPRPTQVILKWRGQSLGGDR